MAKSLESPLVALYEVVDADHPDKPVIITIVSFDLANTSELIRKLLDDHIQQMGKVEPDSVKLGYTLKRLVAEKQAKEEEMKGPQREYEHAHSELYWAEDKEKRLLRFLETPEEQIKVSLPKTKGYQHYAYVTVPDPEKTLGSNNFSFDYHGENRQYFLDKVHRMAEELDQPEYKQEMKRMKEKKDITEKIYNAYVRNIELLDKEINKLRQRINLLNKQT